LDLKIIIAIKLLKLKSQARGASLLIPLPGLIHGKFGSTGNETWTDMMASDGTNCILWVSSVNNLTESHHSIGMLTESHLQLNYIVMNKQILNTICNCNMSKI
jgi:hypothetical protein